MWTLEIDTGLAPKYRHSIVDTQVEGGIKSPPQKKPSVHARGGALCPPPTHQSPAVPSALFPNGTSFWPVIDRLLGPECAGYQGRQNETSSGYFAGLFHKTQL